MSYREKSQKQLQVAETIKRELANLFIRGDVFREEKAGKFELTVAEADISPDLKNVKVFINIFGEIDKVKILKELNDTSWFFQKELAKLVRLRNTPKIHFILDEALLKARKIEEAIAKDSKNFGHIPN